MKSLAAMLEQISALAGTPDLSRWEAEFVSNIVERTRSGRGFDTTRLSPKQVETIERLYQRHFGDVGR